MKEKLRFAENLNRIMRERKLNASSVARLLSINRTTLYNYLNGVPPRGLLGIQKLAEHLEIPTSELLFGDPKPNKKTRWKEEDLNFGGGSYELTVIVRAVRKIEENENEIDSLS